MTMTITVDNSLRDRKVIVSNIDRYNILLTCLLLLSTSLSDIYE